MMHDLILQAQPGTPLALFRAGDIDGFEREMLKLPQQDGGVVHRFGPGLYVREITVPAGNVVLGHYQKFPQMNIFLSGKVLMLNEDGSSCVLEAPMQFVGQPGRKCGIVLETMVWQNIYATELTDIEELEEHFLDRSQTWKSAREAQMQQDRAMNELNRLDYQLVLRQWGISEEQAWAESCREDDLVPFPYTWGENLKLAHSPIAGRGLFATVAIAPGHPVGPMTLPHGKGRTPLGRFTNHSRKPNAAPKCHPDGSLWLYACKPILGCAGGWNGDEITVDYREMLKITGRAPTEGEAK